VDQSRLTVSCRHAADPSLTDKDGKQDTEEDDDEKELHGVESQSVGVGRLELYAPRRIRRLRDSGWTVKGRVRRRTRSHPERMICREARDGSVRFHLDESTAMHNNAV
jgi:hypothetical protein